VRQSALATSLALLGLLGLTAATTPDKAAERASTVAPARVVPGRPIEFPADYGSHPEFRTEWWYVTGWLKTAASEPLGFQVTFFRTRPPMQGNNPSAFTPRQLIIAHAAISDPAHGHLWQDQRIQRAGFGLAEARTGNTDVWIGPWSLRRADGVYSARIAGEEFTLDLRFADTQAPLLNGDAGTSRKGPDVRSASYYYSVPHLRVTGAVTRAGQTQRVTGEAWLDHEWSSEYLDPESVGWDWIGINLDDGGALMAFQIRGVNGERRWSGGSLRAADGSVRILSPDEVQFSPGRSWRSPRTGVAYPVEWQVAAGPKHFQILPLLDDQENDTRLSTGAIYWEGAVRVFEQGTPPESGTPPAWGTELGRGYLELTGYGEKLRLR
jgi:predicted secreted hydrolase